MSKININGIEYQECFYCGNWVSSLICQCREESKSKAVLKMMDIFRKKYNYFLFTTPYHGKVTK